MEKYTKKQLNENFNAILLMYAGYFFCYGTLAPNISNIVPNLAGATESLIAMIVAIQLIIQIFSILFFGYYSDRLTQKFSRKTILITSNLFICAGFLAVALSVNIIMFSIFYLIASFGTGAFLPIGFAIIGDTFPPEERGNRYGLMQFGLILGAGGGLIFGGLIGGLGGPLGWRFAYIFAAFMLLGAIGLYYRAGINIVKGLADPEISDFKGEITYDYRITFSNLKQILKNKSVAALFISVMLGNVMGTTMGVWAIYFLETKVPGTFTATTLYMLAGMGGLPGTIIGGKLGDSLSKKGKKNGRAIIGLLGAVIGISFSFFFYLFLPFNSDTIGAYFLSFILFSFFGFSYFMFTSFGAGNAFAIYSECCVPENRSIANALNGLMANIGGVIGNIIIFLIVAVDLTLLPVVMLIVILTALAGSFFWLIPYFYYTKESQNLRETMVLRREQLDKIFENK